MISEGAATILAGIALLITMIGGHVTTQTDIAVNSAEIDNIDTRLIRIEDKIDILLGERRD